MNPRKSPMLCASAGRLMVALVMMLSLAVLPGSSCGADLDVRPTVADAQAVHAGVQLGDGAVRSLTRVVDGGLLRTDADGRARLRLDDGTSLVVDGDTEVTVRAGRVELARGRVMVLGAPGARTEVAFDKAVVLITGGNAAVNRAEDGAGRVYASSGELVVRAGERDFTVGTGETARVRGDSVEVEPERAFDDWTAGLVAPWGASGRPRRAVAELWGSAASAPVGDPGSPLTIRSQDVSVRIVGESALTVVTSTFFHAGSEHVTGDFRMAIPADAIVSGFAVGGDSGMTEARIGMAAREGADEAGVPAMLEWAGDGWVRGRIPSIAPGQIVRTSVRYVEFLPGRQAQGGVVLPYRFPMVAGVEGPIIGEFSAQVDLSSLQPKGIAAGYGASVSAQAVAVRKSDFRPSADLVVEVRVDPLRGPARMYVAPHEDGDEAGDYVLVRAEVPEVEPEAGVSLAVVVDSSGSVDAGVLETERAFVEALLQSLGERDEVVVLAADETVRPLGPGELGKVDEGRRKAVREALGSLQPGGATDLGRAIERGGDALGKERPAAMVVYVGDGWPTVGDLHPDDVRARLARREGGAPRLAAVAVGALANRFALASLVRGSGPLLDVGDLVDAPAAAASLLAGALQPSVADVQLDLGPGVEQVYPLYPRAVRSGGTVMAIGRTRGEPPAEVTLHWRDAKSAQQKKLRTARTTSVEQRDIQRRWAQARVEELALRRGGREAVTDVALRANLMTPWTGWMALGSSDPVYKPTEMPSRVLDLVGSADAIFTAELASPRSMGSALLDFGAQRERENEEQGDDAVRNALRLAIQRTLDDALDSVRACRDSRAALRPDLAGTLSIRLMVDGGGRASDVTVQGAETARDEAMLRCVRTVVEGLTYPRSGLSTKTEVVHVIALPSPKPTGRTKCSATSQLPVALRRGVWAERLVRVAAKEVYLGARRSCELPDWAARRSLLELVLQSVQGPSRVELAGALETEGQTDAAAFLRREALRRARFPEELTAVRAALLRREQLPVRVFEKQYGAARNHEQRLAVVERFLQLAPHNPRLRRQQLVLLEALGRNDAVRRAVVELRRDPFADAGLLAAGASVLKRLGDTPEALRAFGEIVERAPNDPWARAFTGDWLRREGLFDAATAMYEPLDRQMGADQAVLLRLALAHAGAARLDLATRMLTRLTQTDGRSVRGDLSEIAQDIATVMLIEPREQLPASDQAELRRRAMELPRQRPGITMLIRSLPADGPVQVVVERGPKEAREERVPDVMVSEMGIARLRLEGDGAEPLVVRLIAPEALEPAAPWPVRLDMLVVGNPVELPVLVTREVQLARDGTKLELSWTGDRWQ